jgi:AraC family cel operon transcriptional repressor
MRCLTLDHLARGHYCTYAHHHFQQPMPGSPHVHRFYELFWIEEGRGWHWVNGQKRALEPGRLVLVRASDAHAFSARDGDSLHIANFAFFTELWRHYRRRYYGGGEVFFAVRPVEGREFDLDSSHLNDLRQAARHLRAGRRDRLTTERFLLDVLGILESHGQSRQRQAPAWLRRVCEDLKKEPPFEEGVLGIARRARKSPEHIAREFRRYLGQSPTDYLNDLRMSHAVRKLIMTDEEIVDIAMECGLQNLGHFYKLFRARLGQAPHAFRVQQRQTGLGARG